MRDQIRVLLITSKVLQICADLFAVFGVAMFAYIYFVHFRSDPMAAIQNPTFVVILLIPFVPAAVPSYLASQKRKKNKPLPGQNPK